MMTGLRAALIRTGNTQELIARELGISASHVSEWANGQRDVPTKHLVTLSRLLSTNPDDLLGWRDRV